MYSIELNSYVRINYASSNMGKELDSYAVRLYTFACVFGTWVLVFVLGDVVAGACMGRSV